MSGVLIKNGTVVNDDRSFAADVYVEDGIIKAVGSNLNVPVGVKTICAAGKLVMPGGIDTHTHMQFPFQGVTSVDDFYIGTRAALAGGTTMILDFVMPDKGESLLKAYKRWRGWADPKVCCDYSLHVIVTWWSDQVAKEMETLTKEEGVNSYKVFMTFKDELMLEDYEMYHVFSKCRELKCLPLVHAENGHIIPIKSQELIDQNITGPEGHLQSRPEEIEEEATQRAVAIANQARSPLYVVHVNCKQSANVVSRARREGKVVIGESIAAALGVDGTTQYDKCWKHAAAYVMGPPLRADPSVPGYLMDKLANNELQLTGTDNCTFSSEQKARGKHDFREIPHGINGVEDRMSIIWEKGVRTGKMDPCRFVAVTSTTAAKVFNIYPKKGRIAVGSDADIVVWDPVATRTISAKTHHQAVDTNIFEGQTCHGVANYVLTNGHVAVENREVRAVRGQGKYVPKSPNAQFVYERIDAQNKINKPVLVKRDVILNGVV